MMNVNLFEFQNQAVNKLLDFSVNDQTKDKIVMKAPTGAGKTIILLDYIDSLLSIYNNYAFVWLCPGKGDLEEQSFDKMKEMLPGRNSQNLFDALQGGFGESSTTFINWELITKKDNNAIKDSERKNLYDRIDDAKRNNIKFILIIDEEHSNNTKKADDIISYFNPERTVRVSATAKKNNKSEFYEIDEQEVINSGLITKAIYVNEGIENDAEVNEDYNYLLPLADEKRKEIAKRYNEKGILVRPLVLIQFPNAKPKYVEVVEKKLEEMGYTYDNGTVSKWMSNEHKGLPEKIKNNDGEPLFLLMKQAISTGWDCPRAKIIVKLRENMSEDFTVQTIGRIRRMPEQKHYEDDLLDFSYVYTFDEKYKNGLISDVDKAYEVRRVFVKDKCKIFTLEKENKDLDYDGLGARDVLDVIYNYYIEKYKLSNNMNKNKEILENNNYTIGKEIRNKISQGKVGYTEQVAEMTEYVTTRSEVNTHSHGIQKLHSVDELKHILKMNSGETETVLKRLFRKNNEKKHKLLSLDTGEYYAFIINNLEFLKRDLKEVVNEIPKQKAFHFPEPKKSKFKIPEQDFLHYDSGVKNEVEFLSNAYKEYTSGYVTTVVKSTPEIKFEKYCEKNEKIDWVYKNGDKGQLYFSIVYIDNLRKQSLFYPDYIIKEKTGDIWIIETKGGEKNNQSQNIDAKSNNKFLGFKRYAEEKNIKWGFVREKDEELYINNTEYSEELNDDSWVKLENEL